MPGNDLSITGVVLNGPYVGERQNPVVAPGIYH